MKLSAVIFDLDGTVVADEDEYGEAFSRILKRLGVEVKSKYPHVGGIGVKENWEIFLRKYKIKTSKTPDILAVETQTEYEKLISKVTLKKGFIEFVENLKESGVLIALATSNTWETVEKLFDHLGIDKYFDSVTTGEEVGRKKPDPDLFLLSADKMAIDPSECLVIEDAQSGIEAARAADMKVIAVYRDEDHKKSLTKADRLYEDFSEISIEDLFNL